jgi:uncharacterized membrane protein (GlpM family)
MDWGYKAMLTTVTVALVLLVAQTFGRRLAGLIAGLPVITAPALVWLASEHGAAFAARTAVGSITACGLMALFALVYERISRRRGPAASLGAGAAVVGLVAAPAAALAGHPLRALAFTLLCCAVATALLPASRSDAVPARRRRGDIAYTAVMAGLVSVVATLVARTAGPFWAGVTAALPVISAAALVHQHLTASHDDIRRFLRGYVAGLSGKAVFALVFAAAVIGIGAPAAVAVAVVAGVAVSLAAVRGLSWFEARRTAPRGVSTSG